ncbi:MULTISPECIES: hypothetical protein [Streptomyces]|uniref:Uncharacterized protein n=1 Tax=Streptomyces sindenensis TaxID=67363 RepID=A0ABW6ESI9_9ACTN
MRDTHAHRAARGRKIAATFLAEAPAHSDIADRIMRANAYVGDIDTTDQDPWSEGVVGLRDALVDLLHHADGWYTPNAVLDAAISAVDRLPAGWAEAYRAYGTMPTSPTVHVPDTEDLHHFDLLVGAAAELLMAGPAQFNEVTANSVADAAETRFMDEAEAARFGAVRNAREAAASS